MIIEINEIINKCIDSMAVARGKKLQDDGNVLNLYATKISDKILEFDSDICDDSGEIYHTYFSAKRDYNMMHICTGGCECQDNSRNKGFCKHLVAMTLETNECFDEWEMNEVFDYYDEGETYTVYDDTDLYDETMYVPKVETSKELLDIISEIELRDRNRFCREISQGNVDIEVTLQIFPDSESITLKIGKTQMYVVKNIAELVHNIKQQNYVRYGKNLEFLHAQSAFSKETLPFVSFLLRVQFPDENRYYGYWNYGDKRKLELNAAMIDSLMDIYCGKSINVDCSARRKVYLAEVKDANPYLPVKIEKNINEDIVKIEFPKIYLLEGVRYLYVYWNDVIYRCSEEYCNNMYSILKTMAVNYLGNERESVSYYSYSRSYKSQCILELTEKDYSSFVSTLLPVLEQYTKLTIKNIDFTQYVPSEVKFELYLDMTEERDVICEAKAIYGEEEYTLTKTADVKESFRDIRNEYEMRTLIKGYFPEKTTDGKTFLLRENEEKLAELVENGIRQFEEMAEVYVSERLKAVRVVRKSVLSTGLSIKGNLLEVSWDVSEMSQEELYDVLNAFKRKKKYYRLKNGELLKLDESGLNVLADMNEDMHLTKSQLNQGKISVPVYRALYMDALVKENAERIQIRRDEEFSKYIDKLDNISHKVYPVPDEIQGTLRKYQKDGVSWARALAELGFGGILADDMGLGKTLQMITFLCSQKNETHLIVCPASLVYNWEAEFQKFAPSMKVCLMTGNAAERKEMICSYRDYDVVVTSYDLLKRDIEYYEGKAFGCEIIDEAQYIKNPLTQASKAVKAIDSRIRFALTGTPIENRLSELWSIFEYLMPGYLYSYKHFKEVFETKIIQNEGENYEKALKRLQQMISPFLMRRLKKEVLKDLPDKIEEIVYTKFDTKQEKLYRATEKNIVTSLRSKSGKEIQENKLQILAEITRLRQICCDPSLLYTDYKDGSAKLETCMEVIGNAIEGGHRILLFSQFTSMFEILERRLIKAGISFFVLTGSTSKIKRKELVRRFQNKEADIFLISLKAGGTGLNLTAADVVIHYDPWWNVAAQNQATDRTHRIGQENEVTVLKLIAKGTIEERIIKLQEKKKDLADKVMEAEGVSVSSLSKEELLELFA